MNTGLTFTKADLVECGDAVVSYGQIHSSKNDKVNLTEDLVRYIPKSISNVSALVPKGSFIFADTSEDLEGCGNAAYNNSDRVLYAGYHTIILRRKNAGGKYLAYLFQTDTWRSQIRSRVSGVKVYSVTQAILATTSIILPPLAEQEAIAEWLDEKCQEIDAAIAKVDREIELIDELKQSEISRVVTRGLNPDISLRPSGIDWIGDIPAHWRISPIKHICRSEKYSIKTGPFGSQLKGEDLKEEGDVRVYNQRNVIDNDFSEVSNYVTATKAKDLESFYTLPNDLLVTSRGTIGKSAILPVDVDMGILHPCLIALRIDESKANLNWVQIWINESDAFSKDIEAKSNATTIDVIYTETIKNIRIALPPLSEQQEIVDYLDKKCAEIDGLKEKLTKKRETLTELRQSIISEVVTGKRKVI